MESIDSYQQEDTTVPDLDSIDEDLLPERVHRLPIYSNQQIQQINTCYEQNYAHLRQIFNTPQIQKAIKGVIHLADHIRKDDEDNNVISISLSD